MKMASTCIPLPMHDGCSGDIRGTYRGLTAALCTIRLDQQFPPWSALWPQEAPERLLQRFSAEPRRFVGMLVAFGPA